MAKKINADFISSFVFDLRESASGQIEKFTAELRTNPKYALEWRCPVEAAAQLEVAGYLQNWIERAEEMGADPENVAQGMIQHAMSEVLRMAERTNQSTSPISNLMERHVMAVWAQLASKAFDKARFGHGSKDDMTVIFKAVPSATAGKED